MPGEDFRATSPPNSTSASSKERQRSRSPRARTERPRQKDRGFKWKKKRPNEDEDYARDGDGRLERGYKDHYRARSPRRDQESDSRLDSQRRHDPELPTEKKARKEKKEKKEKRAKKAAATSTTQEAMIIVNVNDRLGTKAAIPCYASDPIKLFKAQVAARIGREPHEILLKRQGERPFKDQLTLEDYGVSNGVQLDLEVDTGD